MTMKSIKAAVLELPAESRGELAAFLLSSLDAGDPAEIERAWLHEADRRYKAYLGGRTRAILSRDAFAAARKALRS